MDLSSLSNEQLIENLRSTPRRGGGRDVSGEKIEEVIEELHVQRLELEMQNRALREAEREIEAALDRYCDLYDHLPIGHVTLARNGRIAEANLTAAAWLRHDRAKLIDSYFSWFLDAFDAGKLSAHIDGCIQSGREQTVEVTLRLEGGLLMTVQLTSRAASSGRDGEAQVHTAITNISKLQQADVLAHDIDGETGDSAQSVTQHLKAPLAAINALSRALLQEHAAGLSPEAKGMIERVECSVVRMESHLQQLLEYCWLAQEDVALDPVNLEELMQHVVMEHRLVIERRGARISVERPLPCVRGARLLLAQVLVNVVLSALNHTAADRTPALRISAVQQEREIVLTVYDDSRPDPAKPAEERFRVFERLHENGSFHGGIGLAIVRRAIERMKGRVWVDSGLDQGTSINIALPAV